MSRFLFKYRKFDKGCIELLLNKQLWFASPASLNDPFEGEASYSAVLEAVWDKYPFPKNDRIKFKEILDQQIGQSGICSFSRARKNQLMWAHYADEHKGLCIGFRERFLTLKEPHLYPIDVIYQADFPFEKIIQRFKCFEKYPGMNNVESIAGDILYSIFATKYSSWKYERERRLLRHQAGAVSFQAKAVNSIAFGLRMPEEDKETVKRLLSGSEWKHVKWFNAVKSKTKFALEFEKI